MQKFVDKTIKPVLIIGGLGTTAANLDAFFPRFAVENVQKMEFVPEYTIFVQHWGIMVGVMGIFMVVAAFREPWRVPVLLYCLIGKTFWCFWWCPMRTCPSLRGFMCRQSWMHSLSFTQSSTSGRCVKRSKPMQHLTERVSERTTNNQERRF